MPLAQTLWSAGSTPVQRLALSPEGDSAALEVAEDLAAIPVVSVELYPGVAGTTEGSLDYTFSLRDGSGGILFERGGSAAVGEKAGGPRSSKLRLRFRELTIPSGRWVVRFDAGADAGSVRGVELRLLTPSPGLIPALMTTLVLAILGWLAACLGALQWIRVEAARPAAAGPGSADEERARLWMLGCHLSALLGYILPFGHLLGPLVIWLAKRHASSAVERAGRSALNFQLSITIYVLVGLLLSFFLIGVVVLFVLVVFHFAAVLYASLRAQRGLDVVYPFSLRFI